LGQVRNYGFARHIAAKSKGFAPGRRFYRRATSMTVWQSDLDKAIEPFSKISAPYGSYLLPGNHEEFSGKPHTSRRFVVRDTGP